MESEAFQTAKNKHGNNASQSTWCSMHLVFLQHWCSSVVEKQDVWNAQAAPVTHQCGAHKKTMHGDGIMHLFGR